MRRQLLTMYTLIAVSLVATVLALLHCAEWNFVYDNPCDETGINYQGCHGWTITFDANGGTLTTTSVTTDVGDILSSLPTPTKSGYIFDGWYMASTGGTRVTTSTKFIGNTTIYARWGGVTFADSRDGNSYKRVQIGNQVWMAENLNYDVPNVTSDVCYANADSNCVKYGRLYDWGTAMGLGGSYYGTYWGGSDVKRQGVCPVGWHLPSSAEWTQLTDFVGGSSTAGRKLKSTSGWSSNGNGTDDVGFSALPGGYGNSDGGFYGAGNYGDWWCATEGNADIA